MLPAGACCLPGPWFPLHPACPLPTSVQSCRQLGWHGPEWHRPSPATLKKLYQGIWHYSIHQTRRTKLISVKLIPRTSFFVRRTDPTFHQATSMIISNFIFYFFGITTHRGLVLSRLHGISHLVLGGLRGLLGLIHSVEKKKKTLR
jgi:hypothetical protein